MLRVSDRECIPVQVSTIVKAIRLGYRTIDTALLYGCCAQSRCIVACFLNSIAVFLLCFGARNHDLIRDAIEQSGIARDEFFLTSKVGFFPTSLDLPEDPSLQDDAVLGEGLFHAYGMQQAWEKQV